MSFEFILIRPDNIPRHWHYFSDGVKAVLKNSMQEYPLDVVFNNLLAGQWQLWAGFKEGKHVGFIISYVAAEVFFVVQAYIKPNAGREVFFDGMEAIEEKARKAGCTKLDFWTTRAEAFQRRMEKKGYKTGYTQFTKTLGVKEA